MVGAGSAVIVDGGVASRGRGQHAARQGESVGQRTGQKMGVAEKEGNRREIRVCLDL